MKVGRKHRGAHAVAVELERTELGHRPFRVHLDPASQHRASIRAEWMTHPQCEIVGLTAGSDGLQHAVNDLHVAIAAVRVKTRIRGVQGKLVAGRIGSTPRSEHRTNAGAITTPKQAAVDEVDPGSIKPDSIPPEVVRGEQDPPSRWLGNVQQNATGAERFTRRKLDA